MGIRAKLNYNLLILLFIAFLGLLIMVNYEVKQKDAHLTTAIIQNVIKEDERLIASLSKNFQDIQQKLNHATETTQNIVTSLYISSYGTLTKSIANQIFPLLINFEIEKAKKNIETLLAENPAISWIEFVTSENPSDDEIFSRGNHLSGNMQKEFSHTIKDDFNYLTVTLQVNLESMEAISRIEEMFSEIISKNNEVVTGITSQQKNSIDEINRSSSSLSLKAQKIMNVKLIAIMSFTFIIVAGLVFFIAGSIVKPILRSVQFAEQIAKGNFSETIKSDRKDELGILTRSLNEMVSSLSKIFNELKENAMLLSSSSKNLSEVSDNLSSVSKKTDTNAKSVYDAAQTMNANIDDVKKATQLAATNIDVIVNSTDEMNTIIATSVKASEGMKEISSHAFGCGQTVLQTTNTLGESAKSITQITETITDISESTNLLALNATIESARAGEAGKGFAVVANEIKDLAQKTTEATMEIKQHVQGIQNSTKQVLEEISEITQLIDNVDKRAESMVESLGVQSGKTNEISDNISSVLVGIKEITDRITENTVFSTRITEQSGMLTQGSAVTSRESLNVKGKSDELNEIASKLFHTVEQFQL
nr:methyl-accepting chemotaxis protein [uncultured Desulfobacter sp.]